MKLENISFAELLKKFPDRLIVGDDLTTTNPERLNKAIEMKSINAIIVKPNQIGSLIKVKEVCEMAKENKIKMMPPRIKLRINSFRKIQEIIN